MYINTFGAEGHRFLSKNEISFIVKPLLTSQALGISLKLKNN